MNLQCSPFNQAYITSKHKTCVSKLQLLNICYKLNIKCTKSQSKLILWDNISKYFTSKNICSSYDESCWLDALNMNNVDSH